MHVEKKALFQKAETERRAKLKREEEDPTLVSPLFQPRCSHSIFVLTIRTAV